MGCGCVAMDHDDVLHEVDVRGRKRRRGGYMSE